MKLFKEDNELRKQCHVLYTTVLSALGHMLAYLKTKSSRKFRSAILRQDTFGEELETKIADIESERNIFNEMARVCHMDALQEFKSTSNEKTDKMIQKLEALAHEVERVKKINEDLQKTLMVTTTALIEIIKDSPRLEELVRYYTNCKRYPQPPHVWNYTDMITRAKSPPN